MGARPVAVPPEEVRGYKDDAAVRGTHAAKKARLGEGALDDEYDEEGSSDEEEVEDEYPEDLAW